MSIISPSPDARKEESKRPQFVTIQIKRGGKLKKQKLNLDFPGDRSLWVSSLENLPPGPRATLRLLVVEFYNVQRQDVFPSCSTIARHTGFSTATIERHLKILRKQGLLSPVGRSRRGVVIYKVHINGLLKEANPKTVETNTPAWLKRNIRTMEHWRGVYKREGTEQDLHGMPFWVAESLFMEGREKYWETKVENPVDKENDLPQNDGGTPTDLPHNDGGTSLKMRDKQKREQKRRFNRSALKSQRPRSAAPFSTTKIKKSEGNDPSENSLRHLAKGSIIGNKPTRNWNPFE